MLACVHDERNATFGSEYVYTTSEFIPSTPSKARFSPAKFSSFLSKPETSPNPCLFTNSKCSRVLYYRIPFCIGPTQVSIRVEKGGRGRAVRLDRRCVEFACHLFCNFHLLTAPSPITKDSHKNKPKMNSPSVEEPKMNSPSVEEVQLLEVDNAEAKLVTKRYPDGRSLRLFVIDGVVFEKEMTHNIIWDLEKLKQEQKKGADCVSFQFWESGGLTIGKTLFGTYLIGLEVRIDYTLVTKPNVRSEKVQTELDNDVPFPRVNPKKIKMQEGYRPEQKRNPGLKSLFNDAVVEALTKNTQVQTSRIYLERR